jgi:hypothetical protein
MNSIFGDATTVAPTPETLAEAESLFGSQRSPVPSLDLRRSGAGQLSADSAIPGLDIDPPSDGQIKSTMEREQGEGLGGWITNIVSRARGGGGEGSEAGSGRYKRVEQDDDER